MNKYRLDATRYRLRISKPLDQNTFGDTEQSSSVWRMVANHRRKGQTRAPIPTLEENRGRTGLAEDVPECGWRNLLADCSQPYSGSLHSVLVILPDRRPRPRR